MSTATELGVIDDSGCLRFKATLHKAEKIAVPTAEDQDKDVGQTPHLPSHKGFRPYYGDSVPTAAQSPVAVAGQNKSNAWVFTEAGGTVRLETPDPLPKALWARLTKYVAMLEPSEEVS